MTVVRDAGSALPAAVLRRFWGVECDLTPLEGEFDLNFLARSANGRHVLKIMRADCDPEFVRMQISAIRRLRSADPALPVAACVRTGEGGDLAEFETDGGERRIAWLQEWLPGVRISEFRPRSEALDRELGRTAGRIAIALRDFEHPLLERPLKWNPLQSLWIEKCVSSVRDRRRRDLVRSVADAFSASRDAFEALPAQAIHNDLNDCNVLIRPSLSRAPTVGGVVDFGDMCRAPDLCELTTLCAYAVFAQARPEVTIAAIAAGFHSARPLSEAELALVWPLLRMRLAVSVVNSARMAERRPDDPYVTVSEAPAWQVLESGAVDSDRLLQRLRMACGMPAAKGAQSVLSWLDRTRGRFARILDSGAPAGGATSAEASPLARAPDAVDSVAPDAGHPLPFADRVAVRYGEACRGGDPGDPGFERTVRLGVDLRAPAGTPVVAPWAGTVVAVFRTGERGGGAVLRHSCDAGEFHTFYGNLNPAGLDRIAPGVSLAKGTPFARTLGRRSSDGSPPHLRFQLALAPVGDGAWPCAADPEDLDLWRSLFPNPAAILNLADDEAAFPRPDLDDVRRRRASCFGANLSLSYRTPAMFVRGRGHYLFDEFGRRFLDAYNNVPHAGHAHPAVLAAASDQLRRVNANTRYLHPAQVEFAEALLARFPASFSKCYFVNSGTEANELALRLARSHTGGYDTIALDHGYHGNSTGMVDLSAYKFNAPGGPGKADWVHLVDLPDDYRGTFRRDDPECGRKYADQVDGALEAVARRGGRLAGFVSETFPSVGGQIVPPPGYLRAVYRKIREAGGVCVADEVQTGLGRLGEFFFGFEQQGALPDIVVLGKPLGNGFPLGAVVTTGAIAERFARGPEFFSTFGGSTLSCRIGSTVLRVIEEEGLQANAAAMGRRLFAGLRDLQDLHPAIGDVRGMGLFVGVDLVRDRATRTPGTEIAGYVRERMRERRILIGCEGPANNVLKIRPPLTIESHDIDCLLSALDEILSESAVRYDCL